MRNRPRVRLNLKVVERVFYRGQQGNRVDGEGLPGFPSAVVPVVRFYGIAGSRWVPIPGCCGVGAGEQQAAANPRLGVIPAAGYLRWSVWLTGLLTRYYGSAGLRQYGKIRPQ
jgi:hypothetical protein